MKGSLEERFWHYVDKGDGEGCWNWVGGIAPTTGYGHTSLKKVTLQAHRVSYEINRGPIPEGLEIDHLCRNRRCVNPDHLEAVTRRVNTLRGTGFAAINARKMHCARGHEFTEENTHIRSNGSRSCKTCKRARWRRWNELRQQRTAGMSA